MEHLIVSADDAGMRLDRFLRQKLARTPLSQVYRLIRTGFVRVNVKRSKENYRLAEGDVVDVRVAAAEIVEGRRDEAGAVQSLAQTAFFKRSFKVLWEDECLLVCDKPANLVVHSGSGHENHDTLIDCATSYLIAQGARNAEPHLAHRIDKDTSGIVLLAKDKQTLRALNEAFRSNQVHKQYTAVCHGQPPKTSGTVEAGLAKNFERNDGTKMTVDDNGVSAHTEYRLTRSAGAVSPRRLYLHATRVSLRHPMTKASVTIEAPLPEAFSQLVNACASAKA
jgi:23S rRNA pseudouridine955/2504/2580 synthase